MVCFATKYRFSTSNDVKALISHASSLEVDFKCQYKTDYVAGGADVLTLPDIIDDSLTANGKWVYSLETVNPTKEAISDSLGPMTELQSLTLIREFLGPSPSVFSGKKVQNHRW